MNARIERLKELLKQSPNDAFVQFALAKEYEKLKDIDKSIDLLQNLVNTNPNYVGAYYHLAALYTEQDQNEKAFEIYDKGMQIAKSVGDQHAFSELQNARFNLEIEL